MKDNRSPFAKARDDWMECPEGKKCRLGGSPRAEVLMVRTIIHYTVAHGQLGGGVKTVFADSDDGSGGLGR